MISDQLLEDWKDYGKDEMMQGLENKFEKVFIDEYLTYDNFENAYEDLTGERNIDWLQKMVDAGYQPKLTKYGYEFQCADYVNTLSFKDFLTICRPSDSDQQIRNLMFEYLLKRRVKAEEEYAEWIGDTVNYELIYRELLTHIPDITEKEKLGIVYQCIGNSLLDIFDKDNPKQLSFIA